MNSECFENILNILTHCQLLPQKMRTFLDVITIMVIGIWWYQLLNILLKKCKHLSTVNNCLLEKLNMQKRIA